MDIKQLFYNPSLLNDNDLAKLRNKIWWQNKMPFIGAAFSGFGYHVIITAVLRGNLNFKMIAAAASVGYFIGTGASEQMIVTMGTEDREVIREFDQRFLRHTLNVAGLASNHTSYKH